METACVSAQSIILPLVGTDGPYLDEAEPHLHRRIDRPACPTIGELLCGMISCLVLTRDGREEKPPSRLCHLDPTTERNEFISFAYVIFTSVDVKCCPHYVATCYIRDGGVFYRKANSASE